MPLRAFAHPLAALLLGASLLVAVVVEQQAPWSERAPWVIAWGFAGYIAVVLLGVIRAPRSPAAPPPQEVLAESGRGRPPDGASQPVPTPEEFAELTKDALQHLNKPDLGERELAYHLPHTIAAFAVYPLGGSNGSPSPVMRTAALRAALVACIERLKSAGPATGEPDGLRFVILHEEYVLGRSNHSIETRYSISGSTFHRYRREATRVVADEMVREEELLAHVDETPRTAVVRD